MKKGIKVVEKIRRKELLLPSILGVIFGIIYFKMPSNIFILLLLGFLAIIATFYNIKTGIYLAVFSMPFLPFTLVLIFMGIVILAYFLKSIFHKVDPFTKHPMDLPIALFAITIIISTITSIDPVGSVRDLVFHLISIGFVFVIVNTIKSKKDLNILLTIIVIAATFTALYGIFQYKIKVKTLEFWTDTKVNPGIVTRVFSFFENPNVLAEYLIMIIPISIALFWNSKKGYKKLIFLFCTIALIAGLGLTYSRGGWIGFIFGAFIFILLVEKKLLIALIPLVLLIIPLLPSTILDRFRSILDFADSSNSSRFGIWLVAFEIIKDNWVAGVGLGSNPFMHAYRAYTKGGYAYYHAHNTYIETAVEMGLAGLIVLLTLLVVIYRYSIRKLINKDNRWLEVAIGGILSGLSAVLVHSLVDDLFFMPKTIITFWTLVSFILVIMRIYYNSGEHKISKSR